MAGLELLSDEGFRLDGRRPSELRKIQCRLGVFDQADGSAYIEQGNTKALATVYGPHEVVGGKGKPQHDKVTINCQYSMATFSTNERKNRPQGDRKSTEMSLHLQRTFEATIQTQLYPRSQIDIFVQILQADGGNYCACVNAATLAIINAGIPMKDYVCACSSGFVNNTPLSDVSYLEESQGGPVVTVALLPKSDQIALFKMDNRLHVDHLEQVLEVASKGCKDMYAVMDAAVKEHVSRMAKSMECS
ncbi:exosome complex component RRP41-like [Lytechinus pictus]|uniref:exosome complex component RRP41-like n=1 Tax=Lytechinus variegatus TaxID=7654 RepID=UPI001BB1B27C|nr:exosome complex component RRP41-like [Lytechinus variegatus]XP_054748398.1 exosome complex component RRP41-like [Lytechinus pictus]